MVSFINYAAVRKLGLSLAAVLFIGCLCAVTLTGRVAAEGTNQFNAAQAFQNDTVLYADISSVGQTINISVCTNTNISIWNTNGTPSNTGDDTALIVASAFTANLACGAALSNPVTGAYKYTPVATGTFRIQISSNQARYDFSVTSSNAVNPDPTVPSGRVWSYKWHMSTGLFTLASATNLDMYVLVPASSPGENFVWKLDLNDFAGNDYSLAANSLGLDPPYSGISATDAASNVTPQFPIYLGFPAVAGAANNTTPTITNAHFLDDVGGDNIFSPNGTVGVQDSGNFIFDTNIDNGNYAITIDTNQDGVYGVGDRLLLGNAVNGTNTVNWDGTYPNGTPVTSGVYHAKIQVRSGEYHFIATDVETSGGTSDGGTTWNPGLTIYRALDSTTNQNTNVYWDDLTEFPSDPDSTANVPGGVTSGSMADANSDNKPDGFHTWGSFVSNSLGNNNNIDTYVYGPSATFVTNLAVAPNETGDVDGVASSTELGGNNFGDGNGDSTDDYLQDNVASLPNAVNGSNYNTVVTSCTQFTSVASQTEAQLSSLDSSYNYPLGLSSLGITCASSGATANVDVYYDKVYDTSTWQARAFVNGHYINIPGANFHTLTVGGTQYTVLSYSITDGGPLDSDGVANGTIADSAGPGVVLGASLTVTTPNTGLRHQSGLIAITLLLAGMLVTAPTVYARITKNSKKS